MTRAGGRAIAPAATGRLGPLRSAGVAVGSCRAAACSRRQPRRGAVRPDARLRDERPRPGIAPTAFRMPGEKGGLADARLFFDGRLRQSENPRIARAARGFFVRRVGGAGYLAALTI